jgi:hypothetical protein
MAELIQFKQFIFEKSNYIMQIISCYVHCTSTCSNDIHQVYTV